MKILVTGATGNVGKEVLLNLAKTKNEVFAAVRNPEKVSDKINNVQYIAFDFTRSETYSKVLNGTDTIFLVRPPAISNIKRDMGPFLFALSKYGIKRIVFLSLLGVENNPVVPHYTIEQIILETRTPYTFLRAGFFMQNLTTLHLDDIVNERHIYLPAGKGKTSFVDIRDIAAIAFNSLLNTSKQNETFDITGSEALTYYEVADIMSDVLKKKIEYKPASIPAFFFHLKRQGHKTAFILVVIALYTITRIGKAGRIAKETPEILGRLPITMRQFVVDHKHLFKDKE